MDDRISAKGRGLKRRLTNISQLTMVTPTITLNITLSWNWMKTHCALTNDPRNPKLPKQNQPMDPGDPKGWVTTNAK